VGATSTCRATVLLGGASPSVPALVHRVQLDHDQRGLAPELVDQRASRLRLAAQARFVGSEGRAHGIVGIGDRTREGGREQLEPACPRGQRGSEPLPPRHREGVLHAQGPGIVVRRLAVHLLPGPAEHHRASRQRQRGLADAAVVVRAAGPQLAQEGQAPRPFQPEAVHQHHHDLAGEGRARPRLHRRDRERRLVVDEGAQGPRPDAARAESGHHEKDRDQEDGRATDAVGHRHAVSALRS